MTALLTAIVTWLSLNFGLPANYDLPAVERLPAAQLAQMRYGTRHAGPSHEVVAVYDDRNKTIFLSADWTGRTPADLSVLVHEMVHHLQNVGGLTYGCAAAREKPAYTAQDAWLGLFGQTVLATFELDAMTLKLRTHCLPH